MSTTSSGRTASSPTPRAPLDARPLLAPAPWALVSAFVAPVALVGGWLYAASLAPGYDPVRQSFSALAAADAPQRWVMTTAFFVAGLAHLVTALGLTPADGAGRTLLGVGGVATMLMGWIPNVTTSHNSVGHMISSYIAFVALSLWPAVIARNSPDAPLVLRRTFGKTAAIVLAVLFVVLVQGLVTGDATYGLRERLLTTVQAVLPLAVVLGLAGLPRAVRRPSLPTR